MGEANGVGGIFRRADDPEALRAWYIEHLGLPAEDGEIMIRPKGGELLIFGFFSRETEYFPRQQDTLVNLRVDDLDAVLERLEGAGATALDRRQEQEGVGRFAWFDDPEGNRVELWEPAPGN